MSDMIEQPPDDEQTWWEWFKSLPWRIRLWFGMRP